MMTTYAIIKTGGKQYSVKPGDIIDVELLSLEKSARVEFKEVLFYNDGKTGIAGDPLVAKAIVFGEVLDQVRGPKVIAYKYKKRHRSTRHKVGHRQNYTRVKILEVKGK